MKKILKKHHIFAISLLFALSGITAVTYSFYADNDSLTNQMKLGIQSGEILEEFDGKEKKVFVENTGTTPLLVRANAKMVCTNDGIVLDASKIAIADYNLTDWMDGDDGWYYYTKVLQPDERSAILVHINTDTQNVPEDEETLYEGAQLDVPVNFEYYFPLNDGSEYSHETAWNIDDASIEVQEMLRQLVDGMKTINAGENIEE